MAALQSVRTSQMDKRVVIIKFYAHALSSQPSVRGDHTQPSEPVSSAKLARMMTTPLVLVLISL
jgi:hypothetical protein